MAFKNLESDLAKYGPAGQVQVMGVMETQENMQILVDHIVRQAGIVAEEKAQLLLDRSHAQVPYDTGQLYGSGRKEKNEVAGYFEWTVLYDAPHAAAVHDVPRNYNQNTMSPTPGYKKAFYLEDPANEMRDELQEGLREKVEQIIKFSSLMFIRKAQLRMGSSTAGGLSSGMGRPRLRKR